MTTMITQFISDKAYVKSASVNVFPNIKMRIEFVVILEDKKLNKRLEVPLAYKDPNWVFEEEKITYKDNSISYKEEDKYTILKFVKDADTGKEYDTSLEESVHLKSQIFKICSGELLLRRSFVEEKIFTFFNTPEANLLDHFEEYSDLFL